MLAKRMEKRYIIVQRRLHIADAFAIYRNKGKGGRTIFVFVSDNFLLLLRFEGIGCVRQPHLLLINSIV